MLNIYRISRLNVIARAPKKKGKGGAISGPTTDDILNIYKDKPDIVILLYILELKPISEYP